MVIEVMKLTEAIMQDIDALIKQRKTPIKQFSIISAMLKTGVYFLSLITETWFGKSKDQKHADV